MELLCWLWWFDRFPRGSASPSVGSQGEGMTRAECPTTAQPTAVDVWLIQLIYETIAAESCCGMCGCPLGRGLQVASSPPDLPRSWTVSIVTRCTGWRRHRHIASATETSDGLELGPFCPSRAAQEAVLRV